MSKKVLVISTSLRKGGNSETLADEFVHGAQKAGHNAENGLQGWIDCFPKTHLAGTVFAGGIDAVGAIKGHSALSIAYEWVGRFLLQRSKVMKRIFMMLCSLLLVISFAACSVDETRQLVAISCIVPTLPVVQSTGVSSEEATEEEDAIHSMKITAGNTSFSATLVENDAAHAFIELMRNEPVVIKMSDYLGFEKVGSLGTSLPTDNSSLTASEGDIVLYNGNQIVVFYGSNSWSYTKIGKIDDLSKWKKALGDGDVTITFSIK